MRRAREIIGLPVLTFDTGRKVHEVKDILIDPEENVVLALLVDEGGWASEAKVVPFDGIHSIGPDAVVIENERAVIPVSANRRIHAALGKDRIVIGTRVFTEDGRDLGTVDDVIIDEGTGTVGGYEVTGGFFADTARGKRFMPAPKTLTFGRDVAFVPSDVGDQMERQVTGGVQAGLLQAQAAAGRAAGGVQAAAAQAAEQAQRAVAQASEAARAETDRLLRQSTTQQKRYVVGKKAGSTIKTPEGRTIVIEGETITQSAADEAERSGVLGQMVTSVVTGQAMAATGQVTGAVQAQTDQLLRQSSSQQKRYVIGRPANFTVRTPDGRTVVRQGDIVTQSDADEAERAGVLGQLVVSVTGAGAQATGIQLQQGVSRAFEDLRQTFMGFGRGIEQQAEEQSIKAALGRPVSRVILDRDDSVILNTGDIITNESIQRARAAGVLDILLGSVARGEPSFGLEERRAPRPGEASLEVEDRGEQKKRS